MMDNSLPGYNLDGDNMIIKFMAIENCLFLHFHNQPNHDDTYTNL